MDLNQVFNAIANQMLSDFQFVHTQLKHMGERGSEREKGLQEFLKNYLPSRYAIATGEIVDTNGNTSRQCDLIIYDHLNCPLLLAGKDIRVFPAESVCAVIEVKSVLTYDELRDAVEKISCLKELERDGGPIPGVIFAYRASAKHEAMLRIARELQKLNGAKKSSQYVDLLCILDAGVIMLDTVTQGQVVIDQNPKNRSMHVGVDLDIS